jgi:hypothetical protein
MTAKLRARVVFSGNLNPDVDAAIAELRKHGYKIERRYPPVEHPLDAFLEVEFDEPNNEAAVDAIWDQIDSIVDQHGGMAEEVYKFGQDYIPHLRLVTD